jgi:hypothetical protein
MVVGKILSIEQVVEDVPTGNSGAPVIETPLPFASRINKDLGSEDRERTIALLSKYLRCFAASLHELGRSNLIQHKIDTGNRPPLHQPPYASAWRDRELIIDQTQKMLKDNGVLPSNSPWASPVVLVKKKGEEWRFCVDYRRLNAVTTKDVYPLPRIEDALSRMEGSRYFTILDMQAVDILAKWGLTNRIGKKLLSSLRMGYISSR